MTVMFNVAEAKAKLSELISRAEAGEEVVIARGGKPAVVLKAVRKPRADREPGAWSHLGPMSNPDIFFEGDPEIEAAVEAPIFPDQ